MAKTIAYVYGTALAPGVSRNGRYYSPELIEDAVNRAQARIDAGHVLVSRDLDEMTDDRGPLSSLTHHDAGDDSEKIAGRIDSLTFHRPTGSAKYKLAVPDTPAGRTMVNLTDTSDGQPPFLKGMSIRAAWLGKVRPVTAPDGQTAESGEALELDGLDFTRRPGVLKALIDRVERVGSAPKESATERTMIYESAPEARVEFVETAPDAGTEVQEKAATTSQRDANVGGPYADPGYQSDGKRRYQLDTKDHVRAAWSYVNQSTNAAKYTAAQLKRIKGRIKAAAAKFGIKIQEGWLIMPAEQITEAVVLTEYADDVAAVNTGGSFRICLTNGPVTIEMSSYCIDPADLEVIGIAAMSGAVDALKALDPDLDADIDVPGADTEDNDMETAPSAETVTEQEAPPPATIPAATTSEEPDVSEPITQADLPATDPATVPVATPPTPTMSEPTLTLGQVKDLFASFAQAVQPPAPAPQLVGAGAPAEAAPTTAAPVAEAAPAPPVVPAAPAAPAPVTETTDQRDQRIAEAAVRMFVQQQAEAGNIGRKGFVVDTSKGVREAADGTILPDGVPDKPFHELTPAEWKRVRNQVGAEAAGIQLPQG